MQLFAYRRVLPEHSVQVEPGQNEERYGFQIEHVAPDDRQLARFHERREEMPERLHRLPIHGVCPDRDLRLSRRTHEKRQPVLPVGRDEPEAMRHREPPESVVEPDRRPVRAYL
jgi:hypothetical protein